MPEGRRGQAESWKAEERERKVAERRKTSLEKEAERRRKAEARKERGNERLNPNILSSLSDFVIGE